MTKRQKVILSLAGVLLIIVIGVFTFGLISGKLKTWADVFQPKPQACVSPPSQPAFPGCEGYGCQAVGWRGGQVIEVTNTNPDGPGSLKAALDTSGPRIVVFRVSGTIDISKAGDILRIYSPNVYIAGQTAPGDGITIIGGRLLALPGWEDWAVPNNLVIRYIRIRPGDIAPNHCLNPGSDSEAAQAISVSGSATKPTHNIVIDHTSLSWGSDEMMQFYYEPYNITFSWNIVAEGLKNCGGRGFLAAGSPNGPDKVSIHHNLFSHNDGRSPRISILGKRTTYDIRNNIAYNYQYEASTLRGTLDTNYIGNYIIAGVNSFTDIRGLAIHDSTAGDRPKVYVQGNLGPGRPTDSDPEWNITQAMDANGNPIKRIADESYRSLTPFATSSVTTQSAQEAYDLVLAQAGAISSKRDLVDQRVVNDVKNRTGKLISSQDEVGGWPVMNSATPPTDTDHDGMPDSWETAKGLNPNDATDNSQDRDCDGYTNIEEYLNSLTSGGLQQKPYSEGDLVKASGQSKIYLIYSNQKHHIPNPTIFLHTGFKNSQVKTISPAQVNQIPTGKPLTRLWRSIGGTKVYHLSYGERYWVMNTAILAKLGYTLSQVSKLPRTLVSQKPENMPLYKLRKPTTSPKVYLIFKNYKRWIVSYQAFANLGFKMSEVKTILPRSFRAYPTRTPNLKQLLRSPKSGKVYYIQNQIKHWVTTTRKIYQLGYTWAQIVTVPPGLLDLFKTGTKW